MDRIQISPGRRKRIIWLFAAGYLLGTVVVYSGWKDIVSGACAMLYLLAVSQESGNRYRLFKAMTCMCWLVYDLSTLALVNGVMQGMLLASIGVGFFSTKKR